MWATDDPENFCERDMYDLGHKTRLVAELLLDIFNCCERSDALEVVLFRRGIRHQITIGYNDDDW